MRQRTVIRQRQKQEFNARFNAALKILQMPSSELAEEIKDVLDSNPLLEEYDTYDSSQTGSLDETQYIQSSTSSTDLGHTLDYAAEIAKVDTVRDHLLQQLWAQGLLEPDRTIAQVIIDAVDDRGYLTESIDDLKQALEDTVAVSTGKIADVLDLVQQFGPPGIAARDLRECLMLQLSLFSETDDSVVASAKRILTDCLELLTQGRTDRISIETGIAASEVESAIALIQTLNPYPGNQFGHTAEAIVPDLIAKKINNKWQIELNWQVLPKLKISSHYRSMIDVNSSDEGQKYLKKNLSQATSFLDNVNRRHETILKVAREIVKRQHLFLDFGDSAMQPLKISEIAEALNLHDSTVSRACARKYIMTPRGTYELRRLFSVRIPNRFGKDESAQAIKHRIALLVAQENAAVPLSDQKINEQLLQSGVELSRRTVAKYRAELGIPARSVRKNTIINQSRKEVV